MSTEKTRLPLWLLAGALWLMWYQLFIAIGGNPEAISFDLRNANYPETYIQLVRLDVSSPNHWLTLSWAGAGAESQDTGPFRSSPGKGVGINNCDDWLESNRSGSFCTPKGRWRVEGFKNRLGAIPKCKYVTWFHMGRSIAFHSHPDIPDYPASHGCVRLSEYAAQLIHNNSIAGKTQVIVDGTWTPPPTRK